MKILRINRIKKSNCRKKAVSTQFIFNLVLFFFVGLQACENKSNDLHQQVWFEDPLGASIATRGPVETSIKTSGKYFSRDSLPFFWMGDTGWLLLVKLKREQVLDYFTKRANQGYNVIQVMVLHDLKKAKNAYGKPALKDKNVALPELSEGYQFEDTAQHDYWDHLEWVIDVAAEKGLYLALVPIWGTNVKNGWVSIPQAEAYARFLAGRFGQKKNIIWLNGGDIRGSEKKEVWEVLGKTLEELAPLQIKTFHPRGRTTSSEWFSGTNWMQFHMSQSGHRRYDQDTAMADLRFGEDNWKYIQLDHQREPLKPSLDGEPSYEGIPQGLHDTTQPYWDAAAVRRYAWWSVLEGAAGFTYGHNAVMQFYQTGDSTPAYGARVYWQEALDAPGALHMRVMRSILQSIPFSTMKAGSESIKNQEKEYGRIAVLSGENDVLLYNTLGRGFQMELPKNMQEQTIFFQRIHPCSGEVVERGRIAANQLISFEAISPHAEGKDWIIWLKKE